MKDSKHQKIHLIAVAVILSFLVGCQKNAGGEAAGDERMMQITHENGQEVASSDSKYSF